MALGIREPAQLVEVQGRGAMDFCLILRRRAPHRLFQRPNRFVVACQKKQIAALQVAGVFLGRGLLAGVLQGIGCSREIVESEKNQTQRHPPVRRLRRQRGGFLQKRARLFQSSLPEVGDPQAVIGAGVLGRLAHSRQQDVNVFNRDLLPAGEPPGCQKEGEANRNRLESK